MTASITSKDIINFWFKEITPKEWFAGGDAFDKLLTEKYGDLLLEAEKGGLAAWREGGK